MLKGDCVHCIYAVEVRRGNPYFLKSEATRKCKDFLGGPGTESKERGGAGSSVQGKGGGLVTVEYCF